MQYLGRDGSPFDKAFWSSLDEAIVGTISNILVGRRIVPLAGPLGGEAQLAKIDRRGKEEKFDDWFVATSNRQVVEIPQIYSDFWLYWRDLESAGQAPDLSSAMFAAQSMAQHEDTMIFYGIKPLGLDGLLTVKGSVGLNRGDWSKGENAFSDIAAGITKLEQNGYAGAYSLVVSPDLYLQLQRIQPGTGMLEIDRISSLIGKKVLKSMILAEKTAVMVASAPYCLDLLIGQDIATAYLETVDMNHHLRIMETALLRIKCPDAVVVYK